MEDIIFEGFTSLFHEPDVIAADGSTVFRLYFDRNYYLINFDLNGGYGVEPVYAKYGSTYNVALPERQGYVFKGWARTDGKGHYLDSEGNVITKEEAEDTAVRFTSSTVPADNMFYQAVWQESTTKYSIIYWIENADDDDYSVIGAKDVEGVISGSEISYEEIANNYDFFSLNLSSEFPTMSADQITEYNGMGRYFELNESKTLDYENQFFDRKFTVLGNGTTNVSVFYDRKKITQRFYYARLTDDGKYELPGSTKAFSTGYGTFDQHLSRSCANGSTPWTRATNALPQIADKYSGRLEPQTYYSAYNKATYYFYEVQTKYYGNMRDSGSWLTDALEPILVEYGSEGPNDYAHFGAWSVEWGTPYARKANKTVKGMYEKLDKQLLNEEQYIEDHDVNPYVLNYLSFWTNVKQADWNKKAKVYNFTYHNYTELLPSEYDNLGNWNGEGGYVDIYKNEYNGRIYGLLEKNIIETYDGGGNYTNVKTRDNYIKSEQTAATLEGFTLMTDAQANESHFGQNPKCDWYAKDIDGDGLIDFDANHHCDIKYFYRRNSFNLKFRNNNELDNTISGVY